VSREEPAEAPSVVSITDVADFAFLKSVWKNSIRKGLRQHKLDDFYLAQDPFQFAAYEWGIDPFIERLRADLLAASYVPDAADIFRGAKGKGLSRPLAFLTPRDSLVFRALISKSEQTLLKDVRPWAGAARKDKAATPVEEGDDDEAYPDFFQVWLATLGIVSTIVDRHAYVVESDISNFFASLDTAVVQEFLLRNSTLDRDAVRLCIHVIRRVLRHPQYADQPGMGLPQEGFDSSRTIAHSILCEVDRAFDVEGDEGVYARFMDDFIAGVDSVAEGERLIARLQRSLEPLGLHPNPAKTRVVPVSTFLVDSMADENAYLQEVDEILKEVSSGPFRDVSGVPQTLVDDVKDRAARLRALPAEQRPRRYDRVLRRYYTLFRKLGVSDWLAYAAQDVASYPGSSRGILEYLRSFPLTDGSVDNLFAIIEGTRDCYQDIPLLALETLATSPNAVDDGLGPAVMQGLQRLAVALATVEMIPRAPADWVIAAAIPAAGKFGARGDQAAFVDQFARSLPVQSVARLQALALQVSWGEDPDELFRTDLAGLPWNSVISLDFVRAVADGDQSATGIAFGLLQPQIRLMPNRYQVHARAILLVDLLARVDGSRLAAVAGRAVELLSLNPARLADGRAVAALGQHLRPPIAPNAP
jgi:hypothetical protein